MLFLVIRYASIFLCSDYIFQKILNTYIPSFFRKLFFIFCSIPIAVLFSYLPVSVRYLSYMTLFLFHFLYYTIKTYLHLHMDLIFISLLFSYGICCGLFVLSTFISGLCVGLIGWFLFKGIEIPSSLLQTSIALFMYLLSSILFRIPRFQKGMPFLKNNLYTSYFSLLGLSILFCFTLVYSQNFLDTSSIQWIFLLFLFILILLLSIFIMWRNQLRQTYLQQLKERENKRLEEQLTDCENTLQTLKLENETLSKLIHRDNKQLASLQLAVETFLSSQTEDKHAQKEIGNTLLQEIRTEMDNRKQLVSGLSTPYVLPSTKVPSADHLLLYMLHRGQTDGIHLELSLTGNVHYLLEHIIKERDFLTLLADILENALIATKCANGTAILLHIGIIDETYSIDTWDSGIPFTKETLLHLGRKRYTTHKKNGGSGIGLMSTFELLEKYQASLYIDEKLAKENIYTKKVSIVFDEKREYHLHTNRSTDEQFFLRQRTDLHIDLS